MNRLTAASRMIIEFIDEWVEKYSGLPKTPLLSSTKFMSSCG